MPVKNIFSIITFFIFCQIASAANRYVSSINGSTGGNGTQGNPYKNLSQLTALAPGDTVFLEAGSVFRESLVLFQGGNASAKVVITSYGSGAKPIISGANTVTNWIQSGNKYYAAHSGTCANFFASNKEMTLARTPDEGSYYWLDYGTEGSINDADLSEPVGFWNGAKICVHNTQWSWEKSTVLSHTAGMLTFTDSLHQSCLPGYGYFLYDKDSCLTSQREWWYDSVAQRIWFIPAGGQDPDDLSCEATVRTNGIQFNGSASYVSIIGIRFEKQFNAGIAMSNQTRGIEIVDCEFFGQYNHGVQTRGKYHIIDHCLFNEVDGHGVDVNAGGNTEIKYCTFTNIGQYRNSGIGGETNLSAIAVNFTDSCHIHHNVIDSAGYCGISADGRYNLIERNIVKHAMLLNNDGAALKTYGATSQYSIFRNNIVSESSGNKEGTNNGEFETPGIYFDFSTNNCTIENNTIYDQHPKGIFQNSGSHHNTIRGNVVFGTQTCLDINGGAQTGDTLDNIEVKRNIFFALNDSAYILRQINHYNQNAFTQGLLDSNYYFQPFDTDHYVFKAGTGAQTMSFDEWRSYSNQDAHTQDAFSDFNTATLTPVLFVNPTDNDSTFDLHGDEYLDLDSNIVCGTLTVPAFYSKVLIATGNICAINSSGVLPQLQFSVFPNPASSSLQVNVDAQLIGSKLQLLHVSGKVLQEQIINSSLFIIDVRELHAGVYFVRVSTIVKKFIKE